MPMMKLPQREPDRIWAGMGTGARCAVCGGMIASDQPEWDLEFKVGNTESSTNYAVHVACFMAQRTLPASAGGGKMRRVGGDERDRRDPA